MAISPLVYYSLGIFWSFFVFGKCLLMIFKNGFKIFKSTFVSRPSVLDNPKYGSHENAHLKNGINLHYVSHGPRNKPLMILLHGFPELWYSWRHQLTAFGDNYRVVAFDQRGYGESDKPKKISDYTICKLTNDVKELIEHLGYTKAVVVGHDWGGAVAWAFAITYPEYVDKLIIMNCPHKNAFRSSLQNNKKQLLKSWYMFFFQLPFLPEWFLSLNNFNFLDEAYTSKKTGCRPGQITSEDIDVYKYTFSLGGFTGPINFYRASMQLTASQSDQTQIVKVPTLLIWGEKDAFISKELAVMSERYCDEFSLKFIENSSHWVQQDYPKEVNQIMRAYLNINH